MYSRTFHQNLNNQFSHIAWYEGSFAWHLCRALSLQRQIDHIQHPAVDIITGIMAGVAPPCYCHQSTISLFLGTQILKWYILFKNDTKTHCTRSMSKVAVWCKFSHRDKLVYQTDRWHGTQLLSELIRQVRIVCAVQFYGV